MKRLTILGIIACVGLLFAPAAILGAGPPGGLEVNVENIPLPVTGDLNATVTGDVNVVNEPTVHVGSTAGEPFQETLRVALEDDLGSGSAWLSIPEGNRLEVEYLMVKRYSYAVGATLSEKVTVRLNGAGRVDAAFTASDFGWWDAAEGERVLLHVEAAGGAVVYLSRDSVSHMETFDISVVGYLFPVQ